MQPATTSQFRYGTASMAGCMHLNGDSSRLLTSQEYSLFLLPPMRKLTALLLISAVVDLTFTGCATTTVESGGLPIGRFRPPQGKNEATILAKMEAPWFESKGIHRLVVRTFSDNQEALAEFFRRSWGTTGSAAGGEMRNDFTLSLLYYWGDHRFGTVLSQQPAEIRRGIGSHLWIGEENAAAFSQAFPETAKAAFLIRSRP